MKSKRDSSAAQADTFAANVEEKSAGSPRNDRREWIPVALGMFVRHFSACFVLPAINIFVGAIR